jgi:PDZ domain-containing protein
VTRRTTTLVLATALLLGLVLVGAFLRVPYVVLVPGPVTDTLGRIPATDTTNNQPGGPVIEISGAKVQPSSGHLYLTTVGIIPGSCSQNPTLWQAIRAWWRKTETVEPKAAQCPPDQSSQQVQQEGIGEMSTSQTNAITAALTELGYHPTGSKVSIASVVSGVPASKLLEARDLIESINGAPVTTSGQVIRIVQALKPGTSLRLGINRHGQNLTLNVRTYKGPDGKAHIGIEPATISTFNGVSVSIGIDPNVIGGPSAGTALALGIIDKLTPGGLTGGRTIAGTGSLTATGKVGPIGGIQQKIAAATAAGATVFFAPASECHDAKAVAPSSMQLISVKTLSGAVQALEAIKRGSTAYPHC